MAAMEVFYCTPSSATEYEYDDDTDDDEIFFCRSVDSVDGSEELDDAPISAPFLSVGVSKTDPSPIRYQSVTYKQRCHYF